MTSTRKRVGLDMAIGSGLATSPTVRQYRSFKKARAFVRNLGLKSETEWREYCESGKKPADIPYVPIGLTRRKVGLEWATGSGLEIANRVRQYRPFEEARAFVRGLGLKSGTEWIDYCKSGKKPDDIPTNPHRNLRESGWAGYGRLARILAISLLNFANIDPSRKPAPLCILGLKSEPNGRTTGSQARSPTTFQLIPTLTYAEGLGRNGRLARHWHDRSSLRQYRPFEEARAFARASDLNLSRMEGLLQIRPEAGRHSGYPMPFTRKRGGLGWAIGLGREQSPHIYVNIGLSRKPRLRARPRIEVPVRMARLF